MNAFPHLKDTESIRAEAAAEHGGLSDAALLVQSWKAGRDPNVEAAALKKINVDATDALREELAEDDGDGETTVHEKVAAHLGDDHGIEITDAAVRGHALSVVGFVHGRPVKVVVPFTDQFKSIGLSPAEAAARANAVAEGKSALLGAEAQAEINRRVEEARKEIMAEVNDMLQDRMAEVRKSADAGAADAADDVPAAKTTEGEGGGDNTDGEPEGGSDGGSSDAGWPDTHDGLDELGAKHKVEFGSKDTKAEKVAKLEAAGVKPVE